MPLVRIDVPDALGDARVAALADAVHEALVTAVGIPPDDRFQVVARHRRADLRIDPGFLGVRRGAEAVIVAITFRAGRTAETKRALHRAIATGAAAKAGLAPADVMVVLTENQSIDWSFGEGIAQYAPD